MDAAAVLSAVRCGLAGLRACDAVAAKGGGGKGAAVEEDWVAVLETMMCRAPAEAGELA